MTKCFGESLSRYYFDRFGIETVCLRIGSSFEVPKNPRMLVTFLSYRDFIELVRCSLLTNRVGHAIVYGASDNPVKWWDNTKVGFLGFRPRDSSEQFAGLFPVTAPTADYDDPAQRFQRRVRRRRADGARRVSVAGVAAQRRMSVALCRASTPSIRISGPLACRAQRLDLPVRIRFVPRARRVEIGKRDRDQVAAPRAFTYLGPRAVNHEMTAERRERAVDAFEIFDDVVAHLDVVQVGDGVGGHGRLLDVMRFVRRWSHHRGVGGARRLPAT